MSRSIVRRLYPIDIPFVKQYLQDGRFDCCGLSDFWTTDELNNWFSSTKDICVGHYIDDRLTGFCLTHFFDETNKVYLENTFVDSVYRRRGIASNLLTTVFEMYADEYPGKMLRYIAVVEPENIKAVELLKKAGFNVGKQMVWVQKNYPKTQE